MTSAPKHERTTIVVIGNGMASHAFCQALVARGLTRKLRVCVFGEERIVAYNRVRLSDVLQSADPDSLALAQRSWYAEHDIELHLGDAVVAIDREAQVVTTEAGVAERYDHLVFATGSAAFRPPIAGIQHPRCHVYRTVEDLAAIDAATVHAKTSVVIGGGLLGLEAAKLMRDRGLSVSVIEAGKSLMHRQLDAATAEVLQHSVEELGVTVHTGAVIEAIEHDDASSYVVLKDDVRLPADVVIVAAGVRARDELAKASGLACNVRGGIAVNAKLVTSDSRVFAVGECASIHGQTYGLYAPCRDMANVLADNLNGIVRDVPALDVSCHLKLLGVDVVALGDYGREHRSVVFETKNMRRTLLLEEREIVGAMSVGGWPELMRVERAIAQHKRVSEREVRRFEQTGTLWGATQALPMAEWSDTAIVCNCARVTAGEIRAQARAGAVDVPMIAERTRATSVCGSCKPLVGALMGDASSAAAQTRTWGVLGLSLGALAAAIVTFTATPLAFASSVQAAWVEVDRMWRDPVLKQWSGYVLVALATLALVISLRKRSSWLRVGSFSLYRAAHALLGLGTLVVLLAHTGFRLGHNLNLMLMVAFLLLNIAGAVTGVMSGLEARVDLPISVTARRVRRPLALAHIVTLWPVPLLLAWHVIAVYYF